jgi:hypothetical protein
MKINIIILLTLFFVILLFSCEQKSKSELKQKTEVKPNKEVEKLKYDQANLFLGTTFGEYFQSLYKLGDYQNLMRFTFIKNLNEAQISSLKSKFKEKMTVSKLKLIRLEKIDKTNFILHYETNENATKIIKRMKVILENDTVKLNPLWDDGIFIFYTGIN